MTILLLLTYYLKLFILDQRYRIYMYLYISLIDWSYQYSYHE